MPVYKFSHHLLAVLVHLAHTAAKWKTNFLILDVGDKLVNTDDTALIKYEKKFMKKAVSIHGVLVHEGTWQTLPSEVIVETVEVAFSRPTLVVRFDNAFLFTLPVIGYDAAVDVPFSEKVWCAVLFLCPLHNNAVVGILHELR